MLARQTERQDANFYLACRGYFIGARGYGGSRGEHVVDNQHMPRCHCFGTFEMKDARHVALPFLGVEIGLRGIIHSARHDVGN